MTGLVEIVLGAAQAAAAIALLYVLPGIALGPVLAPGARTPIERGASILGGGLLAASIAMGALALLGVLRPTLVVAVLLGLTVLPLHGGRPQRPRRARWTGRDRPPSMATIAGVALLAAVAVLAAVLVAGGGGIPAGTSWSTAAAAEALAESGRWPPTLEAWGGALTVSTPNIPGLGHLAAALELLPGAGAVPLALDWLATVLVVAMAATVLLRRAVSAPAAALGGAAFATLASAPGAALASGVSARSIALGLLALWLLDRGIGTAGVARFARPAVAGALAALGGLGAVVLVAVGCLAIGAADAVVAPAGGPETAGGLGHRSGRRIGLRLTRHPDADLLPAALVVAIIVLAAALVGPPLARALAGPDDGAGVLVPVDAAPAGWSASGDETGDIARALGIEPFDGVGGRSVSAFGALLGADPEGPTLPALVMALGWVGALAAWPALDRRRQRWVASFSLMALGGLAVSAVGLPVPTVEPVLWLASCGSLAVALWILSARLDARDLLAAASRRWARRPARRTTASTRPPPRALRPPAPVVRGVVLGAAGALVVGLSLSRWDGGPWREPASHTATTIAGTTTAEAVVLANGWTDGAIGALAARTALLDGPFPDPGANARSAARATALALGARIVFAEPDGAAAERYLTRERVTHVIALEPGRPALRPAASTWAVDVARLAGATRLRQVAASEGVVVFEVVLAEAGAARDNVARSPVARDTADRTPRAPSPTASP